MTDRGLNASGSVMVVCLMVLGVLGVMALWVLKTAVVNRMIAQNQVRQVQTFYLAEAGIHKAIAAVSENPLWRGDSPDADPAMTCELPLKGLKGTYTIAVCDATNDENGLWDPLLAGGVLRILAAGSFLSSYQALSCHLRLAVPETHGANSPKIAIVSEGDITLLGGAAPARAFDGSGQPSAAMLQSGSPLPEINHIALKALADDVVDDLTDSLFDTRFKDRQGFWRGTTDETRPFITWVKGDLEISGNRELAGVFFVEGRFVSISGGASFHGVLHAPNARVSLPNGDISSPTQPVMGQVLSGAGGAQGAGDCLGVQLVEEYVDAFNAVSGSVVKVTVIPGSWHAR